MYKIPGVLDLVAILVQLNSVSPLIILLLEFFAVDQKQKKYSDVGSLLDEYWMPLKTLKGFTVNFDQVVSKQRSF
ncbi:hypothetical protein RIR_jg556.t1 [Rhizophagus irregularis DAOM 181602=DAOM 197198]|nr:hypothetical protein RIR_jg556.t1 [Rhizophagus irregularis DAOM 181602=DAOM 197198]